MDISQNNSIYRPKYQLSVKMKISVSVSVADMLVKIYMYRKKYSLAEYIGFGWTHIGLTLHPAMEHIWLDLNLQAGEGGHPALHHGRPRVDGQDEGAWNMVASQSEKSVYIVVDISNKMKFITQFKWFCALCSLQHVLCLWFFASDPIHFILLVREKCVHQWSKLR